MPVIERIRLDEARAARRSLQAQIARLEGELAKITATTYPPIAVAAAAPRGGTARLLDLAALERARDELAGRVSTADRLLAEQDASQAEARAILQDMLANPERHRGVVITNAQLGLPGCTTYRAVPRLLSRWWHVKVSSGCPLLSAPVGPVEAFRYARCGASAAWPRLRASPSGSSPGFALPPTLDAHVRGPASRTSAARGIHGCTPSVGPTMLQRTP